LGNFVVVGNKCHIVWKIQISIVINKLKMSEDNFVRYEIRNAQDTSNVTINVYNNYCMFRGNN
jgi:transcriptional regulator of met regulon